MLAKEIKTPMIIGVALYGVAVLLNIIVTIVQKAFIPAYTSMNSSGVGMVIPAALFINIIILFMLGVFLFVMITNKDDNRRTVGTIMIAVYLVVRFLFSFAGFIEKQIYSRRGAEILVALSAVDNMNAIVTAPFLAVSTAFVFVAIGRYGVSDPNSNFNI